VGEVKIDLKREYLHFGSPRRVARHTVMDVTRKLLQVHIRLGWYKLEEYYNKLNSLAYVAAVIFHPCSKLKLLEDLWQAVPSRKADGWKLDYLTRLRSRWVQEYRDRYVYSFILIRFTNSNRPIGSPRPTSGDLTPHTKFSYIQRRNRLAKFMDSTNENRVAEFHDVVEPPAKRQRKTRNSGIIAEIIPLTPQDELEIYLSEPLCAIEQYCNNPLGWWKDLGSKRFPKLSYMAVDFLTIASSTAETERQFNSVGTMMSAKRSRLNRHIVGCAQSLRSWSRLGIYKAELPLNAIDRKEQEELAAIQSWDEIIRGSTP
jgi:hypothetical protein